MKKQQVKELRELAQMLPSRSYVTAGTGQVRPVNHVLRMKRAFKRHGQAGIDNYILKNKLT